MNEQADDLRDLKGWKNPLYVCKRWVSAVREREGDVVYKRFCLESMTQKIVYVIDTKVKSEEEEEEILKILKDNQKGPNLKKIYENGLEKLPRFKKNEPWFFYTNSYYGKEENPKREIFNEEEIDVYPTLIFDIKTSTDYNSLKDILKSYNMVVLEVIKTSEDLGEKYKKGIKIEFPLDLEEVLIYGENLRMRFYNKELSEELFEKVSDMFKREGILDMGTKGIDLVSENIANSIYDGPFNMLMAKIISNEIFNGKYELFSNETSEVEFIKTIKDRAGEIREFDLDLLLKHLYNVEEDLFPEIRERKQME